MTPDVRPGLALATLLGDARIERLKNANEPMSIDGPAAAIALVGPVDQVAVTTPAVAALADFVVDANVSQTDEETQALERLSANMSRESEGVRKKRRVVSNDARPALVAVDGGHTLDLHCVFVPRGRGRI